MTATGKQIAAARALLGWDQVQLAATSGLTQATISNIESGAGAQAGSLLKIERAFAREGVTFTGTGINMIPPDVVTFDDFMAVLDDAGALLRAGQDICFHCADDRRSDAAVTERLRAFEKNGLRLRFTYEDGNDFFTTSPANYRWIPSDYVSSTQVQVIYGDRFVIHVAGEAGDKFIMIRNDSMAAAMRAQFYYWWNGGGICG